ncbi:MAG: RNA polymerase sigma factor [Actinomycetota bacterium]
MSPSSEEVIGRQLRAGDDSALQECYAMYGPTVLSYLRRYVGHDEAEDVLQRTFLDVWRGAARYDPAQSLGGWIFTIARRRAVDTLRSRRTTVVSVDVLREVVGDDGRDIAEKYAWSADLRTAMSRLPQAQRQALEMAYFEDRTQKEIAHELDVPVGTVKARMARGTRALADLLHDNAPAGARAADGTRIRGGELR